MAAYQQIVDEIRMLLPLAEQTPVEQVRRLAELYNAACQETNARLFRCADLLARGLRSEAIHIAQAEPVLLDIAAALDFPERRQWEQLCGSQAVPLPQQLNLETATLLNEAYADDQPLEELLRKHRLLNLGRAPVAARLGLLRRLAELDSRNPTWDDDVRTFERARLQELQSNLDVLVQQKKAQAVMAAAHELTSAKWRIAPPAALVTKAQAAAKRFEDTKTLEQLKALETKLNDAMAACDANLAISLRGQWNQLVAKSRPSPADPIWKRVNVVLNWVDQQAKRRADDQAFQGAVNRLEAALGSATSAEHLEAPYAQVRNFNRDLPAHVQARYEAVAGRLRFAAKKRQALQIGVPVLAVLLLGLGVAWWLIQRAERGRVSAAASTVEDFLEKGQVAKAKAYFSQLEEADAAVAQSAELQALKVRLRIAEQEDGQRRQEFEEAMAKAQAAGLTEEGDRLVQRAQGLAVAPEEKTAVQQLLRQRQAKKTDRLAALEKDLMRQADALALKLDELEAVLARPYDATAVAKTITEHGNAAQDMLDQATGVSPELKQRLQALVERAQAARSLVQQNNAEALGLSDLTFALESSGGVTAYIAALGKFVAKFPDSERGKLFKQVLAEQDLWEAAFAWQRLVGPTRSRPLDVKPLEASKLAEQLRQQLKKYPRAADARLAEDYVKGLDALAQRDENDPKSTASDFRRVFGALTVKDVWFLRTNDGKVFYSTDNLRDKVQNQTSGFVGFPYLIAYDGKTKTTSRRVVTITGYGRAPQALIAEDVASLSTGFAEHRWDETVLTFAKKVRASAEMDPILKMILLRQVLECGSRASYPLAQVLGPHIEEFQNARLDITVPWMDPDSEAALKQRPLAREFINQLPPYDKLEAAADAVKQKLAAELASQRVVLGWLHRPAKEWSLASYVKPTDKAILYVIVPGGPEQPAAWQRIGATEPGKVIIQPSAPEHLLEGRLVFAVRTSGK